MMRTLSIQAGNEYRTYVHCIYREDDFFYQEYCQAAYCVEGIVYHLQEYIESLDHQRYNFSTEIMSQQEKLLGYSNNIVAFCAKRGQGKSSAMLSFAKALERLPQDIRGIDSENITRFWINASRRLGYNPRGDSAVLKESYVVLDPIEPSAMEQNDSVMRIIIGNMYHDFEQYWMDLSDKRGMIADKKDNLLQQFEKCFHELDNLKKPQKYEESDDLSRIADIGTSVAMKKSFTELVKVYLDIRQKSVLVIQVDDADLNTMRAYEIVEDVRKYCGIPRMLVLMAMHLGTLLRCVEQNNVQTYSCLLRSDLITEHMESSKCRNMAELYIDKLLPSLHQIHLPYVEDVIRKENGAEPLLKYMVPVEGGTQQRDLLCYEGYNLSEDEKYAYQTYQARLFRIIYEKTGIILTPRQEYMHNFLPERMRELTHLLSFLNSLDDVEAGKEETGRLKSLLKYLYSNGSESENSLYLDRRIKNLEQFERYFIYHWCAIHFSQEEFDIIEKIMRTALSVRNRHVIEYLSEYCEKHKIVLERDIYQEIKKNPDSLRHVTYGQTMDMLEQMKRSSAPKYKFIYAIQLQYTIYFNQLLCQTVKKRGDFHELLELIHDELYPRNEYENSEHCTGRFIISTKLLSKMMGEFENHEIDTIWYCVPCTETGELLHGVPIVSHSDNARLIINKDIEWASVDVFHLLLARLETYAQMEKSEFSDENCAEIESILQVLCNYDVQYYIKKECISKWKEELSKEGKDKLFKEQASVLLEQCNIGIGNKTEGRQMLPIVSSLKVPGNRLEAIVRSATDRGVTSNASNGYINVSSIDLRDANPKYCVNGFLAWMENLQKEMMPLIPYNNISQDDVKNFKMAIDRMDITHTRLKKLAGIPVFQSDINQMLAAFTDFDFKEEEWDQKKVEQAYKKLIDVLAKYARFENRNKVLVWLSQCTPSQVVKLLLSETNDIFKAISTDKPSPSVKKRRRRRR